MISKLSNKTFGFAFLFICFSAVLYWGIQKEGYFIDEIYSFGIANSQNGPFITNGFNSNCYTLSHNNILDYLTVNSNEKFDFENVYLNTKIDNGAPLYYMMLHTICSLFPGKFHKWFGLSINLLFLFFSLILIRKISYCIYESKKASNASMFLFGTSTLIISLSLMIRFYMLLIFLSLLYIWSFTTFLKNTSERKKIVSLYTATILGLLTHYFFLYLIAISVFVFFVNTFFSNNKTNFLNTAIVISTLIIATLTLLFLTPFTSQFASSTNSDNGLMMINNILNPSQWLNKTAKYAGNIAIGMPISTLLLVAFFIKKIFSRNWKCNPMNLSLISIVLLVSIATIITAPHISAKYIAHIACLIVIPAGNIAVSIFDKLKTSIKLLLICAVIAFCFLIRPQYVYHDESQRLSALKPYNNSICIIQCEEPMNHRFLTWHLPHFISMNECLVLGPNCDGKEYDFLKKNDFPESIVLVSQSVCAIDGYKPVEHLYDYMGYSTWVLNRTNNIVNIQQ